LDSPYIRTAHTSNGRWAETWSPAKRNIKNTGEVHAVDPLHTALVSLL